MTDLISHLSDVHLLLSPTTCTFYLLGLVCLGSVTVKEPEGIRLEKTNNLTGQVLTRMNGNRFDYTYFWSNYREGRSSRASVYFKYIYYRIQYFYVLAYTLEMEVAHLIKQYVQRSLLVLIKDKLCIGGRLVLPFPNSTQVSFLVAISYDVQAP